jgi:hypothetical protein
VTGSSWRDEAGLALLPSRAHVRGRRLTDRASPADFYLVLAKGPSRPSCTVVCVGRTCGFLSIGRMRWMRCMRRSVGPSREAAANGCSRSNVVASAEH